MQSDQFASDRKRAERRRRRTGPAMVALGALVGLLAPLIGHTLPSLREPITIELALACLTAAVALGGVNALAYRTLVSRRDDPLVDADLRMARLRDRLTGSGSQDDMARLVLETFMEVCGSRAGVLFARTNGVFERVHAMGADRPDRIPGYLETLEGPTGLAITSGRSIMVDPEQDGLEWIEISTPLGQFRPRGLLLIPLQSAAQTVGLVVLTTSTQGPSDTRMAVFESLRHRAAPYLQNSVLRRKLMFLVAADEETGLINRRFGLRELRRQLALAQRHDLPLSVALIDVNGIADVEAAHGSMVAGVVMEKITGRLEPQLRASDLLCRYDTTRLLLAAPGSSSHDLAGLIRRLRQKTSAEPVRWRHHEFPITLSAGVAGWPEHDVSTSALLIGLADEALGYAHELGPGREAVHLAEGIVEPGDDVVDVPRRRSA